MALQQSFEYAGLVAPTGYIKVENVTVDANSMTAMVVWRAEQASAPIRNKLYSLPYELNGVNPLAQAYAGLKALAEFDGAVDL